MTPADIEELFNTVLHAEVKHGQTLESRVPGLTRNTVFNWRNNRTTPTIGDMLNVLYRLNLIDISKKSFDSDINKTNSISSLADNLMNFSNNIHKAYNRKIEINGKSTSPTPEQ